MKRSAPFRLFPALLFILSLTPATVLCADDRMSPDHLATWQGVARPRQQIQLTAPLQGIFQTLHVEEGDHVEADQVLGRMKQDQQHLICEAARLRAESDAQIRYARYAMEEVQIRLEQIERIQSHQAANEWEVRRQRVLRDQAEAELDRAVLAQQEARVAYDLERQRLEEHQLRAPFAGVIHQIIRDPGSTVQQGEPLIAFADIASLRAEIHLPASLYHSLVVGRAYTLEADEPVNRPLEATLKYVSPLIDPASQTVRCTFVINNVALALPAGFHVRLKLSRPPS